MHEVNGTTAIDLGGGDLIVLNGVAAAQLHASDFILAASANAAAVPAQDALAVQGYQVALDSIDGVQGVAIGVRHGLAFDLANDNGALHLPWHDGIAMPLDPVFSPSLRKSAGGRRTPLKGRTRPLPELEGAPRRGGGAC